MKLLALLLLAGFASLRADVLVNSSFADGRAHWKGDAQDVEASSSGDLSAGSSGSGAGVVIKLNPDKWTKIYQGFNIHDKTLFDTVTYKLSEDYKLTDTDSDSLSSLNFDDAPGIWNDYRLNASQWFFIVTGGEEGFSSMHKYYRPDSVKKGEQTMSGKIGGLVDGQEGTVMLALPPGKGSVTFLKIALSPTDPGAEL